MASPSSSLATLRPELSTFFQYDYMESERWFIGHDILPVSPVGKQAGTFGIIPLDQLLKHDQDGSRAPGTGYQRSTMEFQDLDFATKEKGLEEVVDDREAAMYSSYFAAEQVGTRRLINRMLTNAEKRIQSAVMALAQYGTRTHTAAVKWNAAGGLPVDDLELAIKGFRDDFGLIPNRMAINYYTFRALRNNPQVRDRIKSSGAGNPDKLRDVTVGMLEQVFDISISVAGGMQNTAPSGVAANVADIWTDDILITKVATTNDLQEPAIGRTLHWSEDGSEIDGHVESYREEAVRGEVIRARHEIDEKIFYPGFGYVIQDVLA